MYKIRYADITNAEILGDISSKAWKATYKDIIPDEILNNISTEKRKGYFEKSIANSWENNAIILDNDKAVGFIALVKCRDNDKNSSFGEIGGLYIYPQYINQGIGYKLLFWGLNELKKQGYTTATLWVLEENTHARTFYERMGFIHDGTIKEITIGKSLKEYRYIKAI